MTSPPCQYVLHPNFSSLLLTKPRQTTGPSQSDDELDLDDETGISKSRLRIDEARSRFLPSNVDATAVDFSDRVDGKRKSYRTTTRRHRTLEDGTEELADFSDEEGGESLDRKIARLQREIAEAKEEYGKQAADGGRNGTGSQHDKLISLSEVIDEISRSGEPLGGGFKPPAAVVPSSSSEPKPPHADSTLDVDGATYTITYAPSYEESHTLAKAADFDRRLLQLEKVIGVNSAALPEVDVNGLPRAILPTLDALQRQIVTLSQASTTNLDALSRRVRTLTQEAQQLEKARQGAKSAQEALGQQNGEDDEEESEQTSKINALYGTLPTIENLAPLLPPLLDRLRSLRTIHSDAATAAETLERLEAQQSEMAADMKQWREGLEKVEQAIKEGDTAMTSNTRLIEQWVKDLENRVAKLP